MAAVDLPQTTLTRFLEERIEARLALAYREAAEKSGISLENVEKCPNLSLRLVSSYDKSHIVREGTSDLLHLAYIRYFYMVFFFALEQTYLAASYMRTKQLSHSHMHARN